MPSTNPFQQPRLWRRNTIYPQQHHKSQEFSDYRLSLQTPKMVTIIRVMQFLRAKGFRAFQPKGVFRDESYSIIEHSVH
jgi:hypothetical protein